MQDLNAVGHGELDVLAFQFCCCCFVAASAAAWLLLLLLPLFWSAAAVAVSAAAAAVGVGSLFQQHKHEHILFFICGPICIT